MRPRDAFGRVVSCRQVLLLLAVMMMMMASEPAHVDQPLLCLHDAGKLWVATRWVMRAGIGER